VKAINSKIILSGVLAVVLLSGCASAPQVPQDAKEVAEIGDDNLLNDPVDITGFTSKKIEIFSERDENACYGLFCQPFGRDGDKGQITIFTDPETGKTYDEDGQPVNEKGERILRNGYVCKVRLISFSNTRIYGPGKMGLFGHEFAHDACRTKRSKDYTSSATLRVNTLVFGGLLTGAAVAGAAAAVSTSILSITHDDTM
jgi:hypothetical protein